MRLKAALGLALALACMQLPSAGASADVTIDGAIAAVMSHVRATAADLGVTAADVADLAVTDAYRSEHNGVTHVYLRQRLHRLEVLEANLTAGVLRDGRVFHTASRFLSDLEARASGSVELTPAEAFAAAVRELGALAPRETAVPKIVLQPSGEALRVAWNLEIDARDHWWNVAVDAETGAVLAAHDYAVHEEIHPAEGDDHIDDGRVLPTPRVHGPGTDGASYNVFALPLESPNDGPRSVVTNPSDPASSPFGWHDMNGLPGAESTSTNGNNVHAAWDPIGPANLGQPLGLGAEGGPTLTFNHPLDTTQPPATYKDAAITNLFYWNNIVHDVYARFGFTEAAGNFQVHNYTNTGEPRDPVQADAQDGGGTNNANFATPPDGQPPRMQMYIWQNGRQLRDGDLDAGIIIHEYAHGISNRLTGGPSTSSCLRNGERGSEGWSDFIAIATTVLPGDVGATPRGLATYSTGESSRSGFGLRPSRYRSTSNSPTYDSIKTAAVPHGVGWVWASMLWDLHWALADKHGFNPDVYAPWTAGGNLRAIQLVMDGMKLQVCSPGFVDARDGILAADVALTGGADRCTIWAAFARRGLGFSASQGSSSSSTDGVQAFDLPPTCP